MRRDEKVRAIEKRGRASNPENYHFLGDLHVPWFRADTPIGRLKGLQLTDNRAIEKGVEKTEIITKGAQLAASLTQVKLHLLNFRADDPNNWEVAEFFCQNGSRIGDS